MRALLAVIVIFATVPPAAAGDLVNDQQVLACLTAPTGRAGHCRQVLDAPCAHMQRAGLMRACLYRLRLRWQAMLDRELQARLSALPEHRASEILSSADVLRQSLRDDCGRIGRDPALHDPKTASTERNRCRIARIAVFWAGLRTGRPVVSDPRR